jgi:hypothetical protein
MPYPVTSVVFLTLAPASLEPVVLHACEERSGHFVDAVPLQGAP